MPCRDFYDDHPERYFRDVTEPALKKRISFAESALCAALNALEQQIGDPYGVINYKETGITRKELEKWHKQHIKNDVELRELDKKKKIEQALSKLTMEEKKLLGIK